MTVQISLVVALERRQFIPHALGEGDCQAMDGVSLIPFLKGPHGSKIHVYSDLDGAETCLSELTGWTDKTQITTRP